ncbi:MAG: hypothetical protein WC358_00175 [Ignavibacteria bacterium]|jgi:hypothetical protein
MTLLEERELKKGKELESDISSAKKRLENAQFIYSYCVEDKYNMCKSNYSDRIDCPNERVVIKAENRDSSKVIYLKDKNISKVFLQLIVTKYEEELAKLEKEFAELPAEISENKEVDPDA